jgi:Uma2 family endonuclease
VEARMNTALRSDAPIVLQHVSWTTYESLLNDYSDQSGTRLTYDRGLLEIMSPLKLHEQTHYILSEIVSALAFAWDIDHIGLESTTFKREDLERGFEPDACFYLRDVARIAPLPQINLTAGDPPPDLVIEVDFTSPSLDKMPLFAAVGIPEVWRWSNGVTRFFTLVEAAYQEREMSEVLAPLTTELVNQWVIQRTTTPRTRRWTEAIHLWAAQNPQPS